MSGISISVLIPVFNQEQYLLRAISSVVPQLGPRDELIVVDDGSTNLSRDALRVFDRSVLWLRHPVRKGVSAARNLAASRSGADWLKFLDADDVLAPFALSLLRQSAEGAPPSVCLISGGCHRIHNGKYLDFLTGDEQTVRSIKVNNPTLPSACMVKKESFFEVGLFNQMLDFNEDWDLWFRLKERFGEVAFLFVKYPVCYYWIDVAEREQKKRKAEIDGLPVEEYLRIRYGASFKKAQ